MGAVDQNRLSRVRFSPHYSDTSLEMAEQFNAVLTGETTPGQGAKSLQGNLEKIIEQGENL